MIEPVDGSTKVCKESNGTKLEATLAEEYSRKPNEKHNSISVHPIAVCEALRWMNTGNHLENYLGGYKRQSRRACYNRQNGRSSLTYLEQKKHTSDRTVLMNSFINKTSHTMVLFQPKDPSAPLECHRSFSTYQRLCFPKHTRSA
jgi:hypothetical protein